MNLLRRPYEAICTGNLPMTNRNFKRLEDVMNVQELLKEKQVEYDTIPHRDVFDAQRLAQVLHTPGQQVAKTVLLRADHASTYVVAVLPADTTIDFEKVSKALGGSDVKLATEFEIKEHCPDCEMGVLPPFGSQYGMKTLVEARLTKSTEIVFEGDNHHEAIRMRYEDFHSLEQPLVAKFAVQPE